MSRIKQIELLLLDSPEDSFLQHALALEYIKQNDDDKAKIIFENLLNRHRDYVGSYYHLAKLLERNGEEQKAIQVYEAGMAIAKKLNDKHAYGELRSAYEDLTF